MDASHLINVINCGYSKNIEPIISVHDCFGTHPNKMKALAAIVRSEFVLLYTDHNFLEKFNKRVINSINDNNYEIVEIDGQKFVKFFQPKIRKDGTKYCSSKPKLLLIPQTPNTGSLNLKNIIDAIYLIN
jgi:DNA-directed RNA polymerase